MEENYAAGNAIISLDKATRVAKTGRNEGRSLMEWDDIQEAVHRTYETPLLQEKEEQLINYRCFDYIFLLLLLQKIN